MNIYGFYIRDKNAVNLANLHWILNILARAACTPLHTYLIFFPAIPHFSSLIIYSHRPTSTLFHYLPIYLLLYIYLPLASSLLFSFCPPFLSLYLSSSLILSLPISSSFSLFLSPPPFSLCLLLPSYLLLFLHLSLSLFVSFCLSLSLFISLHLFMPHIGSTMPQYFVPLSVHYQWCFISLSPVVTAGVNIGFPNFAWVPTYPIRTRGVRPHPVKNFQLLYISFYLTLLLLSTVSGPSIPLSGMRISSYILTLAISCAWADGHSRLCQYFVVQTWIILFLVPLMCLTLCLTSCSGSVARMCSSKKTAAS